MADNIHIVEADDLYPPNRLLELCQELKIELLIINYLQLLITENSSLKNAYQETFKLSQIVTQLKRIARQLNIPVIVLSNSNKQNYQSMQDKFGLNMTTVKNTVQIARSSDVIMFLLSNNFTDADGNNHSQLDMLANKFLGVDIFFNRKIKNLAHSFPLDKNTGDTYSRLIITKNKTGKCGEILLRYKKALHTFEAINYLTKMNDEL
jgi:replicative DNA helicase